MTKAVTSRHGRTRKDSFGVAFGLPPTGESSQAEVTSKEFFAL